MTPTIPVPASRDISLLTPAPPAPLDEQPAPTLRVPMHPGSGTSGIPLSPPPTEVRRISRSMLAAVDQNVDELGDTFPHVGERFLGFQLVEELGQGAFARVFLANQESLAGRPVALKVTLRPTREAERLARLQHTNVVPVYSVHDARPMQVICMPYLGRRTIADLIRAYHQEHSLRCAGSRKTSGTRAARTTTTPENHSGTSTKSHTACTSHGRVAFTAPADGTTPLLIGDPLAVVKVLAQLAAGLAHAHSRGILHLDLKPANVLYPDIGEPMLLDFNLSFDTTAPERDLVGGTIPYMATEQLLDLRSRGHGKVDARTDLYSLGVMAFEMLTGTVPFPASSHNLRNIDALIAAREQGPPSVRELNPAVTPAVEAIVRKLLAPNPDDRYQTAEELRLDAERHLNNLPLAVVGEPSVRERFVKWRRRNPGVVGRLLGACLLGLAIGLGSVVHLRAEANNRAAAVEQVRVTRAALDSLRLDLVIPNDPAARTRGIAKAEELLAPYGLPDDPEWTKRPGIRLLSEEDRATLTGDLGEIMLLLAQARWEDSATRPGVDRREVAAEALKLNRAAIGCFAVGAQPPLLDRQSAELAAALGVEAPATQLASADHKANAREVFLDAATELGRGHYATAIPLLERAVADQPGNAAAQFCLAYCRQHLGQDDRALERYDTATVLMPTDPRPPFQRGIINAMKCNYKQAEEEYTKAINLDPDFMLAYRNRGFTRLRLGEQLSGADRTRRFQEAEADFTLALELGAPAIQIHLYRQQVRAGLGDKVGAAADKQAAERLQPQQEGDFISRGMTRLQSENYEGALEDFKAAEQLNPRSLTAIRNQLHVLADRLQRTEDALVVATKLTERYPDSASSRIARAVLLARLGRRAEAHAETDAALKLSKDADVSYRAACVYALTSKSTPGDQDKAVAMIERALKGGYRGIVSLRTDPDLHPLRQNKRFQDIVQAAASLFQ